MIAVEQLTRRFQLPGGGSVLAVDGISFTVAAGEVYGLLGPNGAGKTTTINMILSVLEPSAGSITIDGMDLAKNRSQALSRTNFSAPARKLSQAV